MSDEIVFRGTNRSEALGFIAAIRKAAFANGKHKDYEWMAGFASTCLQDEAIEWYESLDVEIQQDWTCLSDALRGRWAQATPEGAPAPAGAPPGQNSFGHLPTQVSGVVKVISNSGMSYLSRTIFAGAGYGGCMQTTDKLDDAVRVTFQRLDGVHEIRFENDFSDYPLLGFHFALPKMDLYTESGQWGYLTPYQVTSTGSILMPKNTWSGSSGHRMAPSQWRIEKDGIMRPYVLDDHTYMSKEMDVLLDVKCGVPYITHNPIKWAPSVGNINARLVFQSC